MHRILGVLLVFVFASADAAFISRLGGQAYYDDVLNITWAADANINSLQDWDDQVLWAAGLTIGGVTGWRLPSVDVNGDETVVACSGAPELACRDNEMGYMFYQNGVTTGSPNPFTDLQSNFYWSGTEHATLAGFAWGFGFPTGFQSAIAKGGLGYAWAVRSGDIAAVPVPAAVWLFGSALGLLGWMRRKRA
jgi:hypothetical protein